MHTQSTILITGAAGFIASCMATYLNQQGYTQLILVDDFSKTEKNNNLESIQCIAKISRDEIDNFLATTTSIDFVIHFGARTDTTEMDYSIHKKLNLDFSKKMWAYCAQHQIPLIYASSAATYGGGEFGYNDDHEGLEKLQPLNPYGVSKHQFDLFAIEQSTQNAAHKNFSSPPHWYGLKFFNVFGPNEYHKHRMASVVFHAYHQIKNNGHLKLFRSHHPDYVDGGQQRDFVYVKDVIDITWWLMHHLPPNGIYNLGTGVASSFLELSDAIFSAMKIKPAIEFINTPIDIREKYQYYTKANMKKLRDSGYVLPFTSLQDSIADYINNYLKEGIYFH